MKLSPERKKFMEVIGGSGDINSDIEKFCTSFAPLLQENHKFLVTYCFSKSFIKLLFEQLFFLLKLTSDALCVCALFLQASVGLDDMKAS